ncbi:branched-chain amino acid--2-keto-4-methylthiobutyrate aminotransferase [Paraburkholderia madseniana]|uniref:branched-chain-amino-acid transaminase n=1 Tax=Paraburkholderia madseniana TaxID=2599607 RepID=A0A6N6W6X1_9BURK|nr:aminotransferase class IV [Paraburkholderia madseniana]KAE8755971.1 branched-chain amino acid--2-keto-4-methylthiobutyrate aminotransferase [Paraburkholderia madseniana]
MNITRAANVMLTDPSHTRLEYAPEFAHGSAYVNGTFCSIDEASVPITDGGFMQADAAYDVVSVSKGFFFRLEDHLERFESACKKFYLRSPYDKNETTEILNKLVTLAGTREAYVWWAVTRGPTPAKRTDPNSYNNRFYAFAIPYRFIASDEQRERGLELLVSKRYIRIPPDSVDPTAKNFLWMDLKLSLFEAGEQGREWTVLCDAQGNLTEGPGVNIFFIKHGELFTPDSGCLEGITRKTTLELAAELGMPVHVKPVTADELRDADEAFITSTAGGIMPVNSVDGIILGGESGPGALTTKLHNLYWSRRWDGWLGTKVNYGE